MYTYKTGISKSEHDNFVKKSPLKNVLQSANWAKVKDNWKHERVGFYKNHELAAVAAILIQPLPLGFTMLYIPRGPIMNYDDKELLRFVVKSLKEIGKKQKALFVKFDPALIYRVHNQENYHEINEKTKAVLNTLTSLGVEWTGLTTELGTNIQPRFQANIYADQFSFDKLSKTMKRKIKTARNKNVDVVFGGVELVEEFATVMKKTEERKNINLRGADYYQKLLETYPDSSFIGVARLHISDRLEAIEKELDKQEKIAAKFNDKTKESKRTENVNAIKRLTEEKEFLEERQVKENMADIIPIGGTLNLQFGDISDNLYAGTDTIYSQYQPSVAVWYETIEYLFSNGFISQNMGGLENDLDGGLYKFKIQFLPTVEEFVGEFNIPVGLLSKPAMLAYKIRKKHHE
ncbi:hypothetical protein HMPREF9318_00723 [Streptococcus urinalis FB127-CNA-2]|uniref:FemAB family protein n=1 Tax=Streptococcus urinalis 2285-97 TaxID=764291 RepID=G5KHG8_9STRE|nr:aminoacyltransferase [Streptococcus urinalis]EHJ56353.1 FemAB family protein [Streptococcus urinalis 2285-97]EKS22525.1 hypothetical protein HMPREF9318_00723 [Streptococcus urinalis FB127-CNA-2]VEF32338.1 peptidoglycan branched peptide synthesis protein,alanine adding enzyme [Streptococcus urinalis]